MKNSLNKFKNLKLLKRNEKLHAGCCYLLNSESVARNLYFEKKIDVIRAHELINKHLCPILDVIDYLFTPNGWLMLVKIKTEKEILTNIDRKLYKSSKMRSAIRHKKIPVIVSECMRYFISGFAGKTNQRILRKGTLISRNFSRFIFENVEIAKEAINKMRKQQIDLCWQRKRYRPSKVNLNDATKLLEKGDVFLCTVNHENPVFIGVGDERCLKKKDHTFDVLRKIITYTFGIHFAKKTPQKTPKNPVPHQNTYL